MLTDSQFPIFKFNNIPVSLRLKMINFNREVEDFLTYSLAYWLYVNLTKNGLIHLRYYHLNEKRFLIPTYLIDLTNSEIASNNHLFSFYESPYFYNLQLDNLNDIEQNDNINNNNKELLLSCENLTELDEIYDLYMKIVSNNNIKHNNQNNNNLNHNSVNHNSVNLNLNNASNSNIYVTFKSNFNDNIDNTNNKKYNILLDFDKNYNAINQNDIKDNIKETGKFSKINYKLKGDPKDNNFWLLNAQEIIIMMGISTVCYNQSYFDIHECIANLYLHKKIAISQQICNLV